MQAAASEWFARRTSTAADWPLSAVLATKGNRTVDVILPAQDEAATVGQIVTEVRESLMTPEAALVDNLVVVDSGSTDATAEVARAAGARVVGAGDPLPNLPVRDGKGEAMWRGLAATDGDLVVFVDADLRSFSPEYVVSLLGPLLENDEIQLVKAVYDRPLVVGETQIAAGGGRVTEIMARPLINALWPELAGVAQPLSGEYASRRDLLETLSFPCGYGVEIGLLVDTYRRFGLAGLAQVDLGERKHEHQDASRLSRMSAQILHAALIRVDSDGDIYPAPDPVILPAFSHEKDRFGVTLHELQTVERPPLNSIPEYRNRV
ncbi:MAG: glucosyl-3-phosphoglycerate synthase [Micrococcales bacterium]|nr:glucosyl-3-phosphoglycerate synthase [Micrococcales bacterium]